MKTFNDLIFNDTKLPKQATLDFDNNYGVSVITGYGAYGNKNAPYEVAVLYNGNLCYSTDIASDVIGYCTEEKVTRIMKQVQELKD